jgi:hypothetical protein
VDLVVELVAGAADALAERVAALEHELLDDAVEDDAVVQLVGRDLARRRVSPLLGSRREADEVVDGLGGVVTEEVDLDDAEVGGDGRYRCMQRHRHNSCIAHLSFPR